jgi:hypothetical protein
MDTTSLSQRTDSDTNQGLGLLWCVSAFVDDHTPVACSNATLIIGEVGNGYLSISSIDPANDPAGQVATLGRFLERALAAVRAAELDAEATRP